MQPTKIELIRPHRHAGRDYPAGAILSLPAHKASWLVGLGVARDVSPAPAAAAEPASVTPTSVKKTKE